MLEAGSYPAVSLARQILANTGISLGDGAFLGHAGPGDGATEHHGYRGGPAGQSQLLPGRSGGTVSLDIRMLAGVVALARQYTFAVSEFCGGSHSPTSRHYAGVTADFNIINGHHVSPGHHDVPAFMARCRALGATEVLGPGFPGHDNHVHAAWPRPT